MRDLPLVCLSLALTLACTPPEGERKPPPGTSSGTPAGTPGGTTGGGTPGGTTSDSGTGGGTTSGIVIDCDNLPTAPTASLVTNARAYHGIVFDTSDRLVGSDGNNLVATDSAGTATPFVPNAGSYEQLATLPNGDIVGAHISTQSIQIITASGSTTNLAQNIGAYGVEVGPDGMIYTANPSNDIKRIDPATGAVEVYIAGGGRSPKVMTWSPDYSRFYFGTLGNKVWYVDLDANYDPIGTPVELVTGVGGWHDGLDADVCGNLYLADFNTSALYKITPDGQVTTFVDPPLDNYGHGVEFGIASGGWNEMALYQPMPYNNNSVSELVIGVPHRTWTGTVLNAP